MSDTWIMDKSAYHRLLGSPDTDLWLARIGRGLVRVAAVTLLEMGFSARSGTDWRESILRPPISLLPIEFTTPTMENRAIEVQGLLAERGHHRAVKVPDLLIAAAGELGGLTVLHVDKDFDLIAGVTGQTVERLAGNF
jgi:predicted nucleic acid-binding protein